MADIAGKVAQIRQAIFGKDVRENIASGIEAINTECENTTTRQDAVDANEQSRVDAENIRKSNEITRQSQEQTRINTFNSNEANRETLFTTNETERDTVIAQFKAWYNSSSLTGRLPFKIDGGDFGDSRTGATYDGGNFGDSR